MDVIVTVCAIVGAIVIKYIFFFFYAKLSSNKLPKKAEPYEIVQRGSGADEKAKHVLVTGGCGFLGSAIVRHLHERFSSRVAISVIDVAVHDKFGPLLPSVTYIRGDVCTYSHVRAAATNCTCVLHNAAMVGDCLTVESAMQRVNETGTRNVVEACLEQDVRNLVHTSSAAVLFSRSAALRKGVRGTPEPALETEKPRPVEDLNGAYARSKSVAERFVLAASSHALRVVVLRPGGIYGTKDPYLICNILAGKPYVAPGDVRVPFVWVEDAARAHVDAVEKLLFPEPDAERIHGRVYHICHDPVRDPFVYREFMGGPVDAERAASKAPAVRQAEAQAGIQDPCPPGFNAYGRKCNKSLSYSLVWFLAAINRWAGAALGIVLIDRGFTPENMLYAVSHWPCDVADARRLLGWEPTPWRVVAARLNEDEEELLGKRVLGAANVAAAGAGKAKLA